ncbi:hypothetical protein NQZ68_016187 [Dissostichus eleginoides]|nr:hypothetical protein NQZ68_016187 [Dissostichus eleginoides]
MEVLNCSASALHPDLPLTSTQLTVSSPRRASRGLALTSPPVAPCLSKTGGKAMTPVLCHGPLRTTARLSLNFHHPPDSPHSTPPPPPRQTPERKQ